MIDIQIKALEMQFVDGAYEVERSCLTEAWSRDAICELIERKTAVYLVAVAKNTVCGIAGMYIVTDEGQITNVAVMPEYRNQGVGKLLFGTLVDERKKRDVNLFTLEVASCNSAAIKLYGGFGFVLVGRRKGFYKNDDALIMQKRI